MSAPMHCVVICCSALAIVHAKHVLVWPCVLQVAERRAVRLRPVPVVPVPAMGGWAVKYGSGVCMEVMQQP
jgi:hypothetical protein